MSGMPFMARCLILAPVTGCASVGFAPVPVIVQGIMAPEVGTGAEKFRLKPKYVVPLFPSNKLGAPLSVTVANNGQEGLEAVLAAPYDAVLTHGFVVDAEGRTFLVDLVGPGDALGGDEVGPLPDHSQRQHVGVAQRDVVSQRNCVEDGGQLVVAVSSTVADPEVQIDLARSPNGHRAGRFPIRGGVPVEG